MQICLYFLQAWEFLRELLLYIKLVERKRHPMRKRHEYTVQLKVANNLPKSERGSTWALWRRLWAYAELPALNTNEKRRMFAQTSETFSMSLRVEFKMKIGDTLKCYFEEDDITEEITCQYSCHYLPESIRWPIPGGLLVWGSTFLEGNASASADFFYGLVNFWSAWRCCTFTKQGPFPLCPWKQLHLNPTPNIDFLLSFTEWRSLCLEALLLQGI